MYNNRTRQRKRYGNCWIKYCFSKARREPLSFGHADQQCRFRKRHFFRQTSWDTRGETARKSRAVRTVSSGIISTNIIRLGYTHVACERGVDEARGRVIGVVISASRDRNTNVSRSHVRTK